MEYSKKYKNGQGAELEVKIKADCATAEDIHNALRLISVGSHYFYQEMAKTWGEVERPNIELLEFFLGQLKGVSAFLPSKEKEFAEVACDLLLRQVEGQKDGWMKDFSGQIKAGTQEDKEEK